jgi:hypothetical protein
MKGTADELRKTPLENHAEAIAESGNTTQVQTLKALQEREKQRSTARKIRYLQGKLEQVAPQW